MEENMTEIENIKRQISLFAGVYSSPATKLLEKLERLIREDEYLKTKNKFSQPVNNPVQMPESIKDYGNGKYHGD
jgi:hypothetical protein